MYGQSFTMFRSVSWHQFITALIILLIIYYFLVVVIYFRHDVVLLSKKPQQLPAPEAELAKGIDDNSLLFSAVHELMEELKGIFYKASKYDYPKEELVMALQVKLRDYPKLKGTSFQFAVNNHIAGESKNKCEADLTDQDIRNLWLN